MTVATTSEGPARSTILPAVGLDDFRKLLREIAELIGIEPAISLSRVVQGRAFYVPHRIPADHWLAKICGVDVAARLAHFYGGSQLTLPVPRRVLRTRDAIGLWDQGTPVDEIAAALGITSRHVRKLLRRAGVHPARTRRPWCPRPGSCPLCGHPHAASPAGHDDPLKMLP